jgi:glutamate N-acetyltransferase/amino-acid N-acetyltransferase
MEKQQTKIKDAPKKENGAHYFKTTGEGITAPAGFSAYSAHAGIKNRKDVMVLASDVPCSVAGVFTTNQVKGAPVIVSMEKIKTGRAQALVANSGCANVLTGAQGIRDANVMCRLTATELGIDESSILVCSTGKIGMPMPMEKIKPALRNFKNKMSTTRAASTDAARAIMTTDVVVKEMAVTFDKITIASMAKGSGMIHPNMATMFCFITTDADISSKQLSKMLKISVGKTFNMISVDSDTSTSDSVIVMANGKKGKTDSKKFQEALNFVCHSMSKKVIEDGEGASKVLKVHVKGLKTEDDAKRIAKAIINSPLVKSGFPTQFIPGRIMSAAGYSGVPFDQNKVDLYYEDELVVSAGEVVAYNKNKIKDILDNAKLRVTLDFKNGKKEATAYGCDLTYDYVKINREYYT